jgi:hypothetical protein
MHALLEQLLPFFKRLIPEGFFIGLDTTFLYGSQRRPCICDRLQLLRAPFRSLRSRIKDLLLVTPILEFEPVNIMDMT